MGGTLPLSSYIDGEAEEGRFQLALSVSDQNQQEAVAELTASSVGVTAASVLAAWALGFVIATGALHLLGIALGLLMRWPSGRFAVRAMGGVIALAGGAFLTGFA